jgi:hypothetical protein
MGRIETDDEEGRPSCPFNGHTIWLEAPITRRKKYHIVTNHEGDIVFNSMSMTEILQFLDDEDISVWRICTASKTYGVVRQYCLKKGTLPK